MGAALTEPLEEPEGRSSNGHPLVYIFFSDRLSALLHSYRIQNTSSSSNRAVTGERCFFFALYVHGLE